MLGWFYNFITPLPSPLRTPHYTEAPYHWGPEQAYCWEKTAGYTTQDIWGSSPSSVTDLCTAGHLFSLLASVFHIGKMRSNSSVILHVTLKLFDTN